MGDYFWYGIHNNKNTTAAAVMYAYAALAGDPHVSYSPSLFDCLVFCQSVSSVSKRAVYTWFMYYPL